MSGADGDVEPISGSGGRRGCTWELRWKVDRAQGAPPALTLWVSVALFCSFPPSCRTCPLVFYGKLSSEA